MNNYEMTIGIECHVQLATKSKLFSPADNDSRNAVPNSKVHEIDFGLPGMLPRLNHGAVELAVKAAKAMNAEVAAVSRFDRKHYFYPDLPNGYQITQMYYPTVLSGWVDTPIEYDETVRIRIHHAHIEMDAGKLSHFSDYSLVDLNRAGTPLIEIVSEPDMHSAAEARAFATELYRLMTFAGVTHGDLYHGNMRFDVNVSVAKKGASELGKRAEVKNLNSFRSVEKAAEYEFKRQTALLEKGEPVVQETRGWDEAKGKTNSQRSKEDAQDYRYMPDADIPPIVLTAAEIDKIQQSVPLLPPQYRSAWEPLELDSSVINSLLSDQNKAQIVYSIQQQTDDETTKRVAHWFSSVLAEEDLDDAERVLAVKASTDDLIALSNMVASSELSSTSAKEIFLELMNGGTDPKVIATNKNLLQVSNEDEIADIVDEVLADNASQKAVEDIKAGNDKAIGFLVGQIMKRSQGKANPELAQKLIRERL